MTQLRMKTKIFGFVVWLNHLDVCKGKKNEIGIEIVAKKTKKHEHCRTINGQIKSEMEYFVVNQAKNKCDTIHNQIVHYIIRNSAPKRIINKVNKNIIIFRSWYQSKLQQQFPFTQWCNLFIYIFKNNFLSHIFWLVIHTLFESKGLCNANLAQKYFPKREIERENNRAFLGGW